NGSTDAGRGCRASPAARRASSRCRRRAATRSRAPARHSPTAAITPRFATADAASAPGTSVSPTETASSGAATSTRSDPRAVQYTSPTARPSCAMPPQSGPHGTASLHTGTGSTAKAHTREASTASTAHNGRAHPAGRARTHSHAPPDDQPTAPAGTEADGIGTGLSITLGVWRRREATARVFPAGYRAEVISGNRRAGNRLETRFRDGRGGPTVAR